MDKELVKLMFLRARDQYESAAHWAILAVVIAAIFHLLTFSRYISINKELETVQKAANDLKQLEGVLSTTSSNLENSQQTIEDEMEQQIALTVEALAGDFQALSIAVNQIREPSTPDTNPWDPDTLLQDNQDMFAQQMPPAGQPLPKTFILDEAIQSAIRKAKSKEELQQLLIPVIDEQIIRPRFSDLNVFWQNQILYNLEETLTQAKLDLEKNRDLYPGEAAQLDEIISRLDQAMTYMDSIVFTPPTSDSEWWSSVTGKQATLEDLESAVISGFEEIGSTGALREVLVQVKESDAEQTLLLDKIKADLSNLEEQFNQQQVHLATLGKPFEFFSVELAYMASIFPLLLGILLSVSIVWPAARLRELAWAVQEMTRANNDQTLLEWFFRRTGIKLKAEPNNTAREGRWPKLGNGNRARLSSTTARVLLFCAWIGIATGQLYSWGQGHTGQTLAACITGIMLVILAGIYDWYIARETSSLGVTPLPD